MPFSFRKSLPALFFSLLIAAGAFLSSGQIVPASGTATAPVVVQFGGNITSASVSPRPIFTNDPAPGNLIVCHYAQTTGTAATPSPDPHWTTNALAATGKNGTFTYIVRTGDTKSTLPVLVTNNPAGGNDPHLACWEVSGYNQGLPVQQAAIVHTLTTTRPSSAPMSPSPVQAELELGYISQSGATPSPAPSATPAAVVTSQPTTGNSGFFGLPAQATYTSNSLPFAFIAGTAAGNIDVFNIDIPGNYACGQTQSSMMGVGC